MHKHRTCVGQTAMVVPTVALTIRPWSFSCIYSDGNIVTAAMVRGIRDSPSSSFAILPSRHLLRSSVMEISGISELRRRNNVRRLPVTSASLRAPVRLGSPISDCKSMRATLYDGDPDEEEDTNEDNKVENDEDEDKKDDDEDGADEDSEDGDGEDEDKDENEYKDEYENEDEDDDEDEDKDENEDEGADYPSMTRGTESTIGNCHSLINNNFNY
ncbi:hypothetical protein Trydic_g7007 [Trypoxylus dichotomus]